MPPEEGDGPPQEESPTEHQPEHQPARQSERNYLSWGSRLIVVALLVATGLLLLIMSRSCGETPSSVPPSPPVVEKPSPPVVETPEYDSLSPEDKECVDWLVKIRKPAGGISYGRAIVACINASL
ncbi:MAG: hypothetical protein AAB579_03685 [Patescibacteria group bacterium]